jgi:prolyl-tRNA synthetase
MFDVPSDAHIASHQLLLRAGMMRKHTTGIYSLLPYGQRVLEKLIRVIDEEMGAIGGQKVTLPLLNARDLWERTGRWHTTGPELMRLQDRHGDEYCLAPTHEEVVTALVAAEVRSYRQLPQALYQVGTKFRDERRPRFGLMRAREFIMKVGEAARAADWRQQRRALQAASSKELGRPY